MKDQTTHDSQLRLTIEVVPSTCWGSNLRKRLSQPAWDKLRHQVYAQYGNRCGICQAEGRLNCHEIWDYDDTQHIQKLQGFIALCDMCHHVKHIGLAESMAASGKLDFQQVINHFLKVNQCSREEYEAHAKDVWETWSIRSNEFDWTTDLGEYTRLVEENPKRTRKAKPMQ